jgi:hypothetical protein
LPLGFPSSRRARLGRRQSRRQRGPQEVLAYAVTLTSASPIRFRPPELPANLRSLGTVPVPSAVPSEPAQRGSSAALPRPDRPRGPVSFGRAHEDPAMPPRWRHPNGAAMRLANRQAAGSHRSAPDGAPRAPGNYGDTRREQITAQGKAGCDTRPPRRKPGRPGPPHQVRRTRSAPAGRRRPAASPAGGNSCGWQPRDETAARGDGRQRRRSCAGAGPMAMVEYTFIQLRTLSCLGGPSSRRAGENERGSI